MFSEVGISHGHHCWKCQKCPTPPLSQCLRVKIQQGNSKKSKTGWLHPASNEISFVPKASPAGRRAPSPRISIKKNPTFLKFSINLDVF